MPPRSQLLGWGCRKCEGKVFGRRDSAIQHCWTYHNLEGPNNLIYLLQVQHIPVYSDLLTRVYSADENSAKSDELVELTSTGTRQPRRSKILVINPNSSTVMTDGLDKMIATLAYHESVQVHTYTAPFGPESINNEEDAEESSEILLKALKNKKDLHTYDGILVACFSVHPLVANLYRIITRPDTPVIGIFEASISTALASLLPPIPTTQEDGTLGLTIEKFGIVTTGTYWEEALSKGVQDALGIDDIKKCKRFKGVYSTGLSAGQLHSSPPEVVRSKMIQATKQLVQDGDVTVICLGCAGMAGMEEFVRKACVEELGEDLAKAVIIVDGVKAGIAMLDGRVRSKGR